MADETKKTSEKVKKFLEKFYKVRRMHEWHNGDYNTWATLSDRDKAGGTLNKAQAKWVSDFTHRDANGRLIPNDNPNISELTDKEWEELYLICQKTWAIMDRNRAGWDPAIGRFTLEYRNLFRTPTVPTAKATTDTAIRTLLEEATKAGNKTKIEAKGISRDDLVVILNKIKSTPPQLTYNEDSEQGRKDKELIQKLAQEVHANPSSMLNGINSAWCTTNNIFSIYHPSGWDAARVPASTLTEFKNNYANFFGTLCKTDSDSKKVFEAFKAYEASSDKVISSAVDTATKDINYNDSKSDNYLPPKHDDKLNFVEQIEKWAGDTYEDYFKKYEGLRGHRVFDHPTEVHAIVKAIDKAGIKPTDGLEKIASDADKLVGTLKITNSKAAGAMKWFGEALKEFQADPKFSHVMKGALKNGRQMRALVSELVMYASKGGWDKDKAENAKIVMELLNVINYANTTSKTLDYLADEKQKGLFTLLSDKEYSWNKNEGMKFITGAMDKTMRWAFLGVGRAGAFLVNQWRQRGKKFGGKLTTDKMRAAYNNMQNQTATGRAEAQANYESDQPGAAHPSGLRTRYDQANADATNAMNNTNGLRNPRFWATGAAPAGATDATILEQQKIELANDEARKSATEDDLRPYTDAITLLSTALELRKHIDARTAALGGVANPNDPDLVQLTNMPELDLSFVTGGTGPLATGGGTITLSSLSEADLQNYLNGITTSSGYTDTDTAYRDAYQLFNDRQNNIDQYERAQSTMKETQAAMDARAKVYNEWDDKHQDMYAELMSYWDTLQDNRWTGHIGSAKRFQEAHVAQLRDAIRRNRAGYHVH